MLKLSKPMLIAIGAVILVVVMFSVKDKGASASTGDCRFTVNADVLNVRSSPDVHAKAVDTLSQGSETDAKATVRHGFRELDDGRWAAGRYLSPVDGATCR